MAAVMAGMVGFGCGGEAPMEEAAGPSPTERYLTQLEDDEHDNQCGKKICFDPIERDKNITHIFLDFGKCPVKDFTVLLETESRGWEDVTDRLKSNGGPCQELNADYRFEVPGPDKEAKVCIIFHDYVTDDVRIGAKSADECRYEDGDGFSDLERNGDCRKCKK